MEIPDSVATVFAVAGGRGVLDPEMRRRRERQVFIVALVGALGASASYGLSLLPGKWDFPVWTFLTNLCGAVIIGFLAGILAGEAQESSRNVALFWKTGFCGGFTTFSTFSLEAWNLLEQGKMLTGGLY
ncbi:fluoride efflux transporter FluC, partial [Segatella copri]|uniref:fluoride efflux transporter FluC n=1 Tax=Segatella copri TaxID=165179 RepID=UPI001F343DC9